MRIDQRDTGAEQAVGIKNSTDALLARLIQHHDFSIPKPPPKEVIEIRCAAVQKEPWFFIESEVEIQPRKITIKDIQRTVAKIYGLTTDDLVCDRRTARIVRPRHIAIYLAKMLTTLSLPEIGRRFGDRDHTSILFAVRKISGWRESDAAFENEIISLARAVGGSLA